MVVTVTTPGSITILPEPDFAQFPLHSPALRMLITNGSYVVLNGNSVCNDTIKNRYDEIIIQLTSYNTDRNEIYGNLLIMLNNILEEGVTIQDSNGGAVRPIHTGSAADIVELVKTQDVITASIGDITDVCFVFNLRDFDIGRVNGQGIRNCYLCRFKHERNNTQLHTLDDYDCFPSDREEHNVHFDECTSSVIWFGISSIQDTIWKALNRYAERQESWSKTKCNMNGVLWGYLVYKTRGVVQQVITQSTGVIRCSTYKGGDRAAKRAPQKTRVLRFETKQQLCCLRKIFGDSVTFGIRKRRPKLQDNNQSLLPLTKINVILGKTTDEEDRNLNSTRVDLFYNDFESFVCLYYDECILSANGRRLTNQRTQENIMDDEFINYMLAENYT